MTNGKRNYKKEYKKYHSKATQKKNRAVRNSARALLAEAGKVAKGDGKDVDHKRALSKGGSNTLSNLYVTPKSKNRSFSRNKDGSMKSQRSKQGK